MRTMIQNQLDRGGRTDMIFGKDNRLCQHR
jgi:hypothetical protein